MFKELHIEINKSSESLNFIVYRQSTTAQYINFLNDNSLIPSSLDQIIKNNLIVYDSPVEVQLPNQSPQPSIKPPTVGYPPQKP